MFSGAIDPRSAATTPMRGITEWRNPRNGVFVCEVHYTADPDKQSAAWRRAAMEGMPKRGFDREMEINWETPAGEPVFPEYVGAEMRREFPIDRNARLLRFWDFGHNCPVTTFAQQDMWGRLKIAAELVLENTTLEQQIASTKAMTLELMGRPVETFDAGDPAAENTMEMGQVRAMLLKHGILLHCRPSNQGSYEAFRSRLIRRVYIPGEELPSPAFLVHPRCPILHGALNGAFHKNPKTGKVVDVHPYKDAVDTVRYGNDNLLSGTADFWAKLKKVAMQDRAW